MVKHGGLIDRAGVVVQATRNRQVNPEMGSGHAEIGHAARDRAQLGNALVKRRISAAVVLKRLQNALGAAFQRNKPQDFIGVFLGNALIQQYFAHGVRADFIDFVNRAHHIGGAVSQPEHFKKAVQNLPVIDTDLKTGQPQLGEGSVNNRRDFGLVDDIECAVPDDINIRLIKFAEAPALGTLAAVHLADLEAAEGEGQRTIVERDVFCQRYGQVEAHREIAVALLEAVNLFFSFAAALSEQHLAGL